MKKLKERFGSKKEAPRELPIAFKALIGTGTFGKVYLARWSGIACAVKKVKKQERDRVLVEVEVMRDLRHPNVVAFLAYEEDESFHYIVMEYCGGVDLYYVVTESDEGRLTEKKSAGYARQILKGLAYLHSCDVLHRDVKLENAMVTEKDVVKLIDFGLAKKQDVSVRHRNSTLGSLAYMAPELCRGEDYGTAADVWAFGVMVYCMVQGAMPYWENRIGDEDFAWDKRSWLIETTESCKHFVDCCLECDQKERPSADEAAKHCWFNCEKY